jgi:hypothetical protein
MESENWVTESHILDDGVSTYLGGDKGFAESVLRDALQRQFQMTTPKLITYSR